MSEPRGITWQNLLSVVVPVGLAGCAGAWALFSAVPEAPSAAEHSALIRRVENLERRVDSLWQRPSLATVEIDGQKVEGTLYGISDTGQELFESADLKAMRTPGGVWRVVWRKGDK